MTGVKKNRSAVQVAMLIYLAGSLGCVEATHITAGPEVRELKVVDGGGTPERQALTIIARSIALALNDAAFRADVKQVMRAAPFKEHKLELRAFMTGSRLARVSSAAGISVEQLTASLQSVRPLEFYMPAASNRSKWVGGPDLLVVSALEDSSYALTLNLRGEEVPVSWNTIPTTPIVSIVPVETRFDRPLSLAEWRNQDDADGNGIGTWVPRNLAIRNLVECGESCGGGGGSYGYQPAGFYMTFSRIVDMGEPAWRGDPEIEVHVHGPTDVGNSQYGADLSCSGEHALPEKTFNQDNAFWNGDVLIWLKTDEDAFNAQFPTGYHVLFWEDDDTACTVKTDAHVIRDFLTQTAGVVGGAALKGMGLWPAGVVWVLTSFIASDFWSASWLITNDDYLGALVPAASHGDSWSDANYTLMKGTDVNGRAMIIVR